MLHTMFGRRRAVFAERTSPIARGRAAAWAIATWTIATRFIVERTVTAGLVAARVDAKLRPLRTIAVTATALVFACRFARWAAGLHDLDIIVFIAPRLRNCLGKFRNSGGGNPDMGFICGNADCTNIVLRHTATAAQ